MSMEYDSENAGNKRKDIPWSKFIFLLYKYKIWFMQNVKIKIDVKHNCTICVECDMWFNKFDICNTYFVS